MEERKTEQGRSERSKCEESERGEVRMQKNWGGKGAQVGYHSVKER